MTAATAGRSRIDVLGCGVDPVDMDDAVARIESFVSDGRAAQVVTFGAEMAVRATHDPSYQAAVNNAELVVADTVGVVWAMRRAGSTLRDRVAGIELVERLCDAVRVPVFFLGGAEGVATEAAAALKQRHPSLIVAGVHHGYFADSASSSVAEQVRGAGARLVLVALGVPRQEFWIRDNLRGVGPATCIGVGGAFDVWSGRSPRAPESWRRAHLEWLYRLVREPSRLGRQLALPEFAIRVLTKNARVAQKP
ncbi:MAG TPA: WecB/TagA/CpsF family glycosyltransferase [Candidatus Eremiobacteraceae bacterium]|nr:WecB/TagA/CpsF family glycosyltransferase [Candidatus Eremiobacteraceae bacterium]